MKKGKIIGITVITAGLLTGCVDHMPELTEEQSALIAEYAADMLLKYSPNYNYRLADEEELAEAETTEAIIEEAVQEQSEVEEEQTQETAEEVQTIVVESNLNIVDASEVDFAETFGIDDVEIHYDFLEVCSSYPKKETESGFAVNAPAGKSLIVMNFTIENVGEDTVICDLFEKDFDISINLNNGNYKKISSTLLKNDFTTYMEEIPSGERREAVIIAETEAMSEEAISSCVLRITTNGTSITTKLK